MMRTFSQLNITEGEARWIAPANIAFVKYWGKKGHQLPANPSISMTLKESVTKTKAKFALHDRLEVELFLDEVPRPDFSDKIRIYLASLATELPWINRLKVRVETSNTFPHGAGIASSASGLAAFGLCFTDFLTQQIPQSEDNFFKIASQLSRLASGSACRSVYGGFATWGDVSDEFASPFAVHPTLMHLKNSILIVSPEEKTISSRQGHGRMDSHPFAEVRYQVARTNFANTKAALKSGDIEKVGELLEAEALSLHAMMMTSPVPFTLLKPASLELMQKVKAFRADTNLPVYFTLDAGPNLHVIYPENPQVRTFVDGLGVRVIHDEMGEGPSKW